MAGPIECRTCGRRNERTPGADLHCSDECRTDFQYALEQTQAALRSHGFAQDAETPNLFTKDGVSVSLEQVMDDGLDKVVQLHQRAVAAGQ